MATLMQPEFHKRSRVLKLNRNTKEIYINTLTPNFEYTNAQNLLVRPKTTLKL